MPKVRLMQCWHCLRIVPSDHTSFQFVSFPNRAYDQFTCNCLKEPWPDPEEADYGEVFDNPVGEKGQ
jgi:hypothetical protein